MEEAADELEAFMVGYVRRGLLVQWPAIEVVGEVCLDDCRRDRCANRYGVDRHLVVARGDAEVSELALST